MFDEFNIKNLLLHNRNKHKKGILAVKIPLKHGLRARLFNGNLREN